MIFFKKRFTVVKATRFDVDQLVVINAIDKWQQTIKQKKALVYLDSFVLPGLSSVAGLVTNLEWRTSHYSFDIAFLATPQGENVRLLLSGEVPLMPQLENQFTGFVDYNRITEITISHVNLILAENDA